MFKAGLKPAVTVLRLAAPPAPGRNVKTLMHDFPNMSGRLEGQGINAAWHSDGIFPGVVRTAPWVAPNCPEVSGNGQICPQLSGNVHRLSRNVRLRNGRVPALVHQMPAGLRLPLSHHPRSPFPRRCGQPRPACPSKNRGQPGNQSTPSQNRAIIPSQHPEKIFRSDVNPHPHTATPIEGEYSRQRRPIRKPTFFRLPGRPAMPRCQAG